MNKEKKPENPVEIFRDYLCKAIIGIVYLVILIALVITAFILQKLPMDPSHQQKPVTPESSSKPPVNVLNLAINAALGEAIQNGEWNSTYYHWFSQSKIAHMPLECSGKQYPILPSGNLLNVVNSNKITFGVIVDEPWIVQGEPVYAGVEADLARVIARRLSAFYNADIKAVFKTIEYNDYFDDLKAALDNNQVDAVIAAASIMPERVDKVDFSCPYFNNFFGVLKANTYVANNATIASLQDLNNPSFKIAVLADTVLETYATQTFKKAQIMQASTVTNMYNLVETGAADYLLFDKPALVYYMNTDGKGKCIQCSVLDVADPTSGQHYGIMTKYHKA